MQAQVRQMKVRGTAWLLAAALTAGGLVMPSAAHAAEAAMTVDLPAGKFKALRLRNLPKDATLAVEIQCQSKLVVSLLNEADAKHFPRADEPVFVGTVERRLSFSVAIPQAGTYFLVFDNRQTPQTQKVKFAIKAERARTGPPALPPPAQPGTQQPRQDKL